MCKNTKAGIEIAEKFYAELGIPDPECTNLAVEFLAYFTAVDGKASPDIHPIKRSALAFAAGYTIAKRQILNHKYQTN